jgi:TonB family protein
MTAPIYPPIAKAAHVSGEVMLLLTIERDGSVNKARVIRGPEMLRKASIDFARGWKANVFGGSRSCPVVVRYALGTSRCTMGVSDTPPNEKTRRVDTQHVLAAGVAPSLCDPRALLARKKILGIF